MHFAPSSILSLPPEILVQIIKGFHIKLLLNITKVHPYLNDIIENNTVLWQSTSFQDAWPCPKNLKHFDKAASRGNFEALVKLGIAYLYNEGLSGDLDGKRMHENGTEAARMFCAVEKLSSSPFTWLFIRPPWSARGACCKQMVFNYMHEDARMNENSHVILCVARIMTLLNENGKIPQDIIDLLNRIKPNSPHVSQFMWLHAQPNQTSENWDEIQHIRELRAIPDTIPEARLELCFRYAKGQYGGLSRTLAAKTMKSFMQNSKPTHITRVFQSYTLTHSMRYILTDWLVEVCNMKDYGSRTLHTAVNLVDRVLKAQPVSRARLQLLGVSCIVICSRLLGKDIVTIREAAWLTDNTYKYEDVVRMIGEITAVVRGQFRELTSFDYLEVVNLLARSSAVDRYLSEYICELALLQTELGDKPRALLAAACVLLARLCLHQDNLWPSQMEEFTGFALTDLHSATVQLHKKCFCGPPMTDHREVELTAVKYKYEDLAYMAVSGIPMVSEEELYELLGLSLDTTRKTECWPQEYNMNSAFISSPCSPTSPRDHNKSLELWAERDDTATPTMERQLGEQLNDLFNRSFSLAQNEDDDEDEQTEGEQPEMAVDLHCADVCNWNSSRENSPVSPQDDTKVSSKRGQASTRRQKPQKSHKISANIAYQSPKLDCPLSPIHAVLVHSQLNDSARHSSDIGQEISSEIHMKSANNANDVNGSSHFVGPRSFSASKGAKSNHPSEAKRNEGCLSPNKRLDIDWSSRDAHQDTYDHSKKHEGISSVYPVEQVGSMLMVEHETKSKSSAHCVGGVEPLTVLSSQASCDTLTKAATVTTKSKSSAHCVGGVEPLTVLSSQASCDTLTKAATVTTSDANCDGTFLTPVDEKRPCDDKQSSVNETVSVTTKAARDSTHSTPKCGSSPGTIQPPIGVSPIGGLSCFKMESSVSRLISTSIKIDFEHKSSKKLYTSKSRASTVCCSKPPTPSNASRGFNVFIDPKTPSSNMNKTDNSCHGLRPRDANVEQTFSVKSHFDKGHKKRRPSGHLENESKKQILTQTDTL